MLQVKIVFVVVGECNGEANFESQDADVVKVGAALLGEAVNGHHFKEIEKRVSQKIDTQNQILIDLREVVSIVTLAIIVVTNVIKVVAAGHCGIVHINLEEYMTIDEGVIVLLQ